MSTHRLAVLFKSVYQYFEAIVFILKQSSSPKAKDKLIFVALYSP